MKIHTLVKTLLLIYLYFAIITNEKKLKRRGVDFDRVKALRTKLDFGNITSMEMGELKILILRGRRSDKTSKQQKDLLKEIEVELAEVAKQKQGGKLDDISFSGRITPPAILEEQWSMEYFKANISDILLSYKEDDKLVIKIHDLVDKLPLFEGNQDYQSQIKGIDKLTDDERRENAKTKQGTAYFRNYVKEIGLKETISRLEIMLEDIKKLSSRRRKLKK